MSYRHPTADFNSAGENPDPITGVRLERATTVAQQQLRDPYNPTGISDFLSWRRLREDVIHFTPIDNLPEAERDAIRVRRREAYKHSDVPWILADYTALMSAYDDVDDLLKTKDLIRDYALTPAARAAKKLLGRRKPALDEKLDGWRESCDVPAPPRERKLLVPGFGGLNLLALLGLNALALLFPSWRLASLIFQALQTTDSLFGVGLQLGPILGAAFESAFRLAKDVGGPIFEFDNKYEQLKGARVIRDSNRALAAARHAHPDDAFTSLTGLYYASGDDILPRLVIDQDDYPSLETVLNDPWSIGKEAFDAGRLAASLPYNLGATALNALLGDTLANWSRALGGGGDGAAPGEDPDNEARALMKLAEQGICPAGQCEGELAQDVALLSDEAHRLNPETGEVILPRDMAKNLGLRVDQLKQIGQSLL